MIPTPELSASEAARRQCDICRAVPLVSVIDNITMAGDGDGDGIQTTRSIVFVGKGNVARDCCKIKDLAPFFKGQGTDKILTHPATTSSLHPSV